MSWCEWTPARGKREHEGVAASLTKYAGRMAVSIYLYGDTMRRMGFRAGDRVSIRIGDGEHAGRIRIARTDGFGYRIMRIDRRYNSHRLVLRPWDGLPTETFPARACRHHVVQGDPPILEIILPSWARPKPARFEDIPDPDVDRLRGPKGIRPPTRVPARAD